MKFLKDGNDLQSVTTSDGKDGRHYYVTDDADKKLSAVGEHACERIIVVLENGSLAPIPFAVCIDFDGTLRLVNLTAALEVEMLDKVVKESGIELPAGVLPGPGHPAFEKPN